MATADLSASTMVDLHSYIETKTSIRIGDSLYFTFESGMAILKYDLVRHGLSVIDAPEVCNQMSIVRAAEDGGLGFAAVEGNNLHLWSWLTGDGNSGEWTLPNPTSESASKSPINAATSDWFCRRERYHVLGDRYCRFHTQDQLREDEEGRQGRRLLRCPTLHELLCSSFSVNI
ncbi:hypothetical protein BAE44_0016262 [Dichanthelium oligosanthes]|uniref:Uncharacterized protein n=1 Tax=Dichanthelium oligosanthes TaxID=888268 RepID=A0A1E5VC46_9POAL|nr:hypothetical protein BAE44_0016262 [Dichanthelium oligosanthes]